MHEICLRLSRSDLRFFIDLFVGHPFVNVCEFGFCNLYFLSYKYVYVCLEVAYFSVMFACWNSIEPIRYGVCNVYVGCGSWFVAGGSFICRSVPGLLGGWSLECKVPILQANLLGS